MPQTSFETIGILSVSFGYFCSRFYTNWYYNKYRSNYVTFRLWLPFSMVNLFVGTLVYNFSPQGHVINGRDYQQIQNDMRAYRGLDETMNMYKDVNDIKYNYDYSSTDIGEIKSVYKRRRLDEIDSMITNTIKERYAD